MDISLGGGGGTVHNQINRFPKKELSVPRPKRFLDEETFEGKCDLHVFFAPSEYTALKEGAKINELTISEFVRMAIKEKLHKRPNRRLVNLKLWRKHAARPKKENTH